MATQRIKTFLWFNDNAEEAVNFYVSLFKTSKILTTHWFLALGVRSMDEAIEWIRRSPFQDGEVELRPVFGAEDFGEAMPNDVKALEEKLAKQLSSRKQ